MLCPDRLRDHRGPTRKVVRSAARHLTTCGHSVEVLSAEDAGGIDLEDFDRVLVAGSIHAGTFQKSVVAFARENHVTLERVGAVFLSVTLAALSSEASEHDELERWIDAFRASTGWTPAEVVHVAGALKFTEYDFLRSQVMKLIVSRKMPGTDTRGNTEFTDWPALHAVLDRLAPPVHGAA